MNPIDLDPPNSEKSPAKDPIIEQVDGNVPPNEQSTSKQSNLTNTDLNPRTNERMIKQNEDGQIAVDPNGQFVNPQAHQQPYDRTR
jgi:hypothetical protein